METTNTEQAYVPRPFFKAAKVRDQQERLSRRILWETRDLNRTAGFVYVRKRFKNESFFESLHCVVAQLLENLHTYRARFNNHLNAHHRFRYLFLSYVLPSGTIVEHKDHKACPFPAKNADVKPEVTSPSFTHPQSGPQYWVSELQGAEAEYEYGQQFARRIFLSEQEEESIVLNDRKQTGFGENPVNETLLGTISASKILIAWLVVLLACIPEVLIYSKIVGSIFHMDKTKMYFAGAVILLLSKTNAMLLYNSAHEFFRNLGRIFYVFQLRVNTFFFVLFSLSLAYSICIGILYNQFTTEERLARNYAMSQQRYLQAQDELETDPKNKELLLQASQAKAEKTRMGEELAKSGNSVLSIITIGFSGMVILLYTSTMFAMSLIFATAFRLRRQAEKSLWQVDRWEAKFNSQKHRLTIFRKKAFHITCLYGQLEFLQRLEQGTPAEAVFHPQRMPLPLGGQQMSSGKQIM